MLKPYLLKYILAPGVTYSDHGRDTLLRLMKENVLCSTKDLIFQRPDLYRLVTDAEIRNGTVRLANLLDQTQTELPTLTREELTGITLGPLSVDSSQGYVTAYQEEDVLADIDRQGNYVNLQDYHHRASQVRLYYFMSVLTSGLAG